MQGEAAITGVGAITPVGGDATATWNAITQGESGITRISRFDPEEADLQSRIAGEVDFEPEGDIEIDERSMGRFAQFALTASHEALTDADLDPTGSRWDPPRVGVSVASGIGGFPEIETTVTGDRVSPYFSVSFLPNLAAGYVSQEFNAQGPNRAPATACAAGTHAISDALDDIRAGRADVMIAGATEAGLSPTAVRGFDAMRALSTQNETPTAASRPFDADRDGFVMAEGAGIVVLEDPDHAANRGVEPIATLTGCARTADAVHPTKPPEDAHGLSRCLRRALSDADRSPTAVDHVNTHGTSTPRGDPHEATAVQAVFDDPPPVTSVKSMTGHTMGASGAIEAVVSAKAIAHGLRPPTINYETPDPACDVPVVETPQEADVDVVVSNSAGFGGTNGTLVLEEAHG